MEEYWVELVCIPISESAPPSGKDGFAPDGEKNQSLSLRKIGFL